MGIFSFLDPALNYVLGPLLNLNPFWAVLIVSFLVSLLITLIYKWMTDQNLMKQLKEEMKEFQKEIKELKNDPSKAMEVQKKAMQTNMKYMMQSMKPTLVTFIPIILIFGWLNAHIAYEPLLPNQDFSVEAHFQEGVSGNVILNIPEGLTLTTKSEQEIVASKSRWGLKGTEGSYFLEFKKGDSAISKKVKISQEREYEPPLETYKTPPFKSIQVDQEKVIVLNLFGWEIGWLGTYIIFSIIFSMLLRKLMKIY